MHDLLADLPHWPVHDFESASGLADAVANNYYTNGLVIPSVVVFNDGSIADMTRVIELLQPCALIQLSDEFGQQPEMVELADRVPLFLRQYRFLHYPSKPNLFQIPLGYMTQMTNGTTALGRHDISRMRDRNLQWAFIGTLKQDRQAMIEAFSAVLNTSYHVSHETAPSAILDIYKRAVFVPNGRGNVVLDCFRLYEASMAGAIPVVVGAWTETRAAFYFEGDVPPWIFETDWKAAAARCAALAGNIEALQNIQEHNLQWWARQLRNARNRVQTAILLNSPLL